MVIIVSVHWFSYHGNETPVSILRKSIAGRYRPVRVADGPITARCRFIKNASWDISYGLKMGNFQKVLRRYE